MKIFNLIFGCSFNVFFLQFLLLESLKSSVNFRVNFFTTYIFYDKSPNKILLFKIYLHYRVPR